MTKPIADLALPAYRNRTLLRTASGHPHSARRRLHYVRLARIPSQVTSKNKYARQSDEVEGRLRCDIRLHIK
jgi:hypothetical protein